MLVAACVAEPDEGDLEGGERVGEESAGEESAGDEDVAEVSQEIGYPSGYESCAQILSLRTAPDGGWTCGAYKTHGTLL